MSFAPNWQFLLEDERVGPSRSALVCCPRAMTVIAIVFIILGALGLLVDQILRQAGK